MTDRQELIRLTEEYGGQWALNHSRRLLHLISLIGESQAYDADAIWLAAHLHDWGGYRPWAQEGVDHALRSKQVAGPFLSDRGYREDTVALVLECIEYHHSGGLPGNTESILLSDADVLDFLGVVGVLRDFSKNPRDLRKGYESTRRRREKLPSTLHLERSKEIAAKRIRLMDELLAAFEADTFGSF